MVAIPQAMLITSEVTSLSSDDRNGQAFADLSAYPASVQCRNKQCDLHCPANWNGTVHARTVTNSDYRLMRRCLELSQRSVEAGEYPYGVVIARHGETIVEGLNCVARDRDVTRHAELVAISEAQRTLGTSSLEDCAIYSSTEPCALCSYAIRESRIGKVVYGLSSPIMGGVSRWNILEDEHLSRSIPEVFAPPPIVLHCFLCDEAEHAMRRAAPVSSAYLRCRGILTAGTRFRVAGRPQTGMRHRLVRFTRRTLFDRFGRHFHDRA